QNCATPIAMGELFNSPHEWIPLIAERLIDYIRVHLSQTGGFTPARKIAVLAETFGVKTAWHGPGDVSPVGHMANVTLDVATTSASRSTRRSTTTRRRSSRAARS
ncbi:MAG: enolase C-terminal domain-like protein, partial [Bryobacteraceae bacterium]